MSIGSWFRRFFRRTGRQTAPFTFSTLEFEPFPIDDTAKELKLKQRAIANGTRQLPSVDDTTLNAPQLQVVQFIKGEVAAIRAGTERTLQGLNGQIDAVDVRHHTGAIRDLSRGLEGELGDLVAQSYPGVARAKDNLQNAQEDLRIFKLRNELDQEPLYPDSRFPHWSVLVFVLVLEAVVNAFFFQQGLPYGLSGGAALALILAFVDVLVVFNLGRLMAWFVSPKWIHRAPAIASGFIFSLWAVFFNLLISHVRETISAEEPLWQTTQAALDRFKENPFGLDRADSWVLFALVLVFSALAMLSGLNWDEKFPGYGRRHRRRNENARRA